MAILRARPHSSTGRRTVARSGFGRPRMKFNLAFFRSTLSLLAFAAGASIAAEPLSAPGVAALRIERGVVYREAPLLGRCRRHRAVHALRSMPRACRRAPARCARAAVGHHLRPRPAHSRSVTSRSSTPRGECAGSRWPTCRCVESRAGGCTLTIGAAWSASSLGQPFSATLVASGGSAPYTFSVISGQLPSGLTLQPNGAISGTPTASASHRFTVVARDAHGASGVHDADAQRDRAQRVAADARAPAAWVTPYNQTLVGQRRQRSLQSMR